MKSLKILAVPFKVKNDVLNVYEDVSNVIGRNEKYLLAIILSSYRTRKRSYYFSRIRHSLINRVERQLVLSVVDFFLELYKVDRKGSKFIVSSIMRCILDRLPV